MPPLSRDLRDFTPSQLGLEFIPFGEPAAQTTNYFPECHPLAVLLPESFRGGCSFGAGKVRSLPQDLIGHF